MVIALERYILTEIETDPVVAYEMAIKRICTTLTGGWFRDYAVEHWPEVREPNVDYVAKFWSNVEDVQKKGEWEAYY